MTLRHRGIRLPTMAVLMIEGIDPKLRAQFKAVAALSNTTMAEDVRQYIAARVESYERLQEVARTRKRR